MPVDQRAHVGIGRDRVRQHRDQRVGDVAYAPAVHLDVEPRQELAVRARRDQQRVADAHGLRQRIVRVGGQDDVDALDAGGQLAVDVEAVVGEQHHHLRALRARAATDRRSSASRMPNDQFGHHPARIGDRRVGEGLADHGDADAAPLEHAATVEYRLGEVGVAHVAGEERQPDEPDRSMPPNSSAMRRAPSVNSQWPVVASTPSASRTATMSPPLVASAV